MTETEQLLEIYQFEGCPFCGKVRQKMTEDMQERIENVEGKISDL
ncbi:hypothetical protein HRED_03294 [Candidatus Haloredivivus sp. G17]|nr:hypothetical protein HRED_03294 [Candidatus Haloredivivus sp. G17]